MPCRDPYGYALTTSPEAAAAYNRGRRWTCSGCGPGRSPSLAASIAHDPTFALGHAALALLGHELCAAVDIQARLRDAVAARRARDRARAQPRARRGQPRRPATPRPLVAHLAAYPLDALLLSTAVPTIAFAGVTEVPAEAWSIVERAIPAYGDDWWFTGLLAFVRQEQGRFDEAMELSCRSLAVEPGAGHSAHARAHAHYETGDHHAGLAWMDAGWPATAPRSTASATSPGTRRCTSCPWATSTPSAGGTTPSSAPSTASAAGRWSTPARCCSAGRSPPTPPTSPGWSRWPRWPAATCSSARRRRSSPCTARSRCWRSTTGPASTG